LADAIYDKYEIKSELVKSGGGAFEVAIDGDKVFSKLKEGRFPDNNEILMVIEQLNG
jgi:selenoprotein W-related protein